MNSRLLLRGALGFAILGCALSGWARAQAPAGLEGPEYWASVRLSNNAGPLPGNGIIAVPHIKVDTGAYLTVVSQGTAQGYTLVKKDGTDNGFKAGTIPYGGATGGRSTNNYSVPLTVGAQGLQVNSNNPATAPNGSNLLIFDQNVNSVNNLRVVYAVNGQSSLSKNGLLGTNYLSQLGNGKLVFSPASKLNPEYGTVSFQGMRDPDPIALVPTATSSDPTLSGSSYSINGVQVNNTTTNFVLATGSPFTILSQSLANSLGLFNAASVGPASTGSFDINSDPADPTLLNDLVADGFADGDTTSFGMATIDSLVVTAEDGVQFTYSNVPVLINPDADISLNVFGTNLLTYNDQPTMVDLTNDTLVFQAIPVPEPSALVLAGIGLTILALCGRARRRAGPAVAADCPNG
jgi:hypothetical protein